MGNYQEFVESKILQTPQKGFEVNDADIHPSSFPHQRDIIKWAALGGRRALFCAFGLGKTHIQLELARLSGVRALIICPLGVKGEFKREAERLGIPIEYVRSNADIDDTDCQVLITNYERVREGGISPHYFQFVSLDEASILRSYGSKTYQEFLPLFSEVKYRYVCTATPSPNRYKELIHYAGFLGIMDTGQALTRFFKRDSTKANNLTLYEHKEKEFWLWMSSWAIFLTKPSDLGYSDEGYDLPPLNVHWHRIDLAPTDTPIDRDGQSNLFKDVAFDLKTSAKEKRESIPQRWDKAKGIIFDTDASKHWLLWHHLEAERAIIEKETSPEWGVQTVYGSQPEYVKERLLIGFAQGKYPILASKPEIAGSGCNFQEFCHSAIFLGIDYKFNDFVQSIHRIHRFGQKHPVDIHIIYTDAEENIKKELEAKWTRHNELVEQMTSIIKEYGLSQSGKLNELKRSIGVERREVRGENFTCVYNDTVLETQQMEDNSVHLIVTSIPFSNHYEYTPSYNDFGHTQDDAHFFAQMDFLTPQLLRILQPGRLACVHVKDRILFGNVTGYGMPSSNPFHCHTILHFVKHGFIYMGMITIETDVVRENNQTYRLGWTEQCKDGSKMGVGSPEYLLLFRKLPSDTSKAYADIPVIKDKKEYTRGQWQIDARAKWNSSGKRVLTGEELTKYSVDRIGDLFSDFFKDEVYDYEKHVQIANDLDAVGKLPATFEMLKVPARTEHVWDDVVRMRTLNSSQVRNRQESHICPLQFDIVDRCINRYSNKGELVFDPFGGLMTVPYRAINLDRKGYGVELNLEYWRDGVRYCKEAEYKRNAPTLFDFLDVKGGAA